ncbi:MAG: hypothetical protein ABI067_17760 [Leifsonia sp.]
MTDTPVVKPDLSTATVDHAIVELATTATPFIPAKVRATIYAVGGVIVVAAGALAPVIGGTVGVVLDGVGAAAGALTSTLALSHITK